MLELDLLLRASGDDVAYSCIKHSIDALQRFLRVEVNMNIRCYAKFSDDHISIKNRGTGKADAPATRNLRAEGHTGAAPGSVAYEPHSRQRVHYGYKIICCAECTAVGEDSHRFIPPWALLRGRVKVVLVWI